ncbi:MAG: UDP-glucose 4-epimerase GalE [Bacteroidota bacterium]|nr:UDP-glucose 4-epimerase GalE [Bacteroidota bacterium]
MSKRILITGGAGYIGSHTVLELLQETNYHLVVFDNLVNGHKEALARIMNHTGQDITFIKGDLLNLDQINSVFETHEIDAVIHFAGYMEAGLSMTYPLRFFENNISGSINLLKCMQKFGVNKIVFSSTCSIYGDGYSRAINEQDTPSPINWYAHSKLTVENILRSLDTGSIVEQNCVKSLILRYFNAAGADPTGLLGHDYPRPTMLIPLAIESVFDRKELFIFGNDYSTPDGTCIRDYVHVSDLARAHRMAVKYLFEHHISESFNLGNGIGYSNLEVVEKIEEIVDKVSWTYAPKRIGDPAMLIADSRRANKYLKWKPRYSLKDIIQHSYQWKVGNPHGYTKFDTK